MYLKTTYNDLRKMSKFLGKVSKTGTSSSAMSVVLETTPDGLEASSLTSEAQCKAHISAEVYNNGWVAVDGKTLSERIGALACNPNDDVVLAESDDFLVIETEKISFEIRLVSVKLEDMFEYKELPGHVEVQPDFPEWLKLAKNASSSEISRGPLYGVNVSEFGLVATDSYRFILVSQELPGITEATLAPEFLELFPDPDAYDDGDISMACGENSVEIAFGRQRLRYPVILGDYPKVSSILSICPKDETPYQFTIDISELKEALVTSAPYYSSTTGATLHPDGNLRIVSSEGEQYKMMLRSAEVELPVPVTFNINFLNKVVKMVKDSDKCVFKFNESKPDVMPFTVTKENITIGMMPQRTV